MSQFEKRGHFGPDLNFEILIFSEIIGNQLSFAAGFMFIAALIHFLCAFIFWPTAKPRKSLLKTSESLAGHYGN